MTELCHAQHHVAAQHDAEEKQKVERVIQPDFERLHQNGQTGVELSDRNEAEELLPLTGLEPLSTGLMSHEIDVLHELT